MPWNYDRRGEKNPASRLAARDVREIRRHYDEGRYSHADIARMFSVSVSAVRAIGYRARWAHISEEGDSESDYE